MFNRLLWNRYERAAWRGLAFLSLAAVLLSACNYPGPEVSYFSTEPAVLELEVTPTAASVPEPGGVSTPGAIQPPSTPQLEPFPTFTVGPTQTPRLIQTPVAPEYPVVGIEMHSITERGGLDLVRQSGSYWVRRNALLWSDVEWLQGDRNWPAVSVLSKELEDASSAGLEVILVVRSTPYWAQKFPGVFCGQVAEDYLDEFGDFLFDAVSRYSVPPYNVKYWELGNEPDIDPAFVGPREVYGCWGDQSDPYYGGGYYAQMLKTVYPRIKAANPNVQVLVGGLLIDCDPTNPPETRPGSGERKDCSASRFTEGILRNGGGDYFDGISFHAYDYFGEPHYYSNLGFHSVYNTTGPVLIAKTRYLRSLLEQYGYFDKFLMNTEVALLCTSADRCWSSPEFEATKANFAAQAYAAAVAEGLRANIWYSITGWRSSGLVSNSMQPQQAYHALQFSATQLQGAAFVGDLKQFAGVMGYEFLRDGEHFWILWAVDDQTHQIPLPDSPSAVYDIFGETVQAVSGQELTLGGAPLYVHFAP